MFLEILSIGKVKVAISAEHGKVLFIPTSLANLEVFL
jgi:hypothetical protein